jgi:hypothetical protein
MSNRHPILGRPILWLIGQAVVLGAILWLCGNLTPDGLGTNDDSREYVEQSQASFQANLSSYRTFGYPLFLRLIRVVSPDYALVPWVQFLLHALAVGCFYCGLRALVGSDWLAMIVASSLLYSNTFLCEGASVLTDAPASSLAIATVGLLLGVVANPRRLWIWAALALCLFLTYQTRPAYQFLIVLVPALGALLVALVGPPRPHRLRQGLKLGAGLAAVALVPFLAFCMLRWAVVGDFGLVSFDGYTLSGITGPFLTEDIVPRLPEDVRPLAKRVIELRDWTAAGKLPPTYQRLDKNSLFIGDMMPLLRKEWPPPEYNSFGDVDWGIMFDLRGVIAHAQAEDFQIDRFQWVVCLPAAQEFAAHPDNPVEINRLLKRLSLSIVKARPLALLKHRSKVVGWVTVLTLVNSYSLAVLLGGLLLFEAARQLLEIGGRLRRVAPATEASVDPAQDATLDVILVSCIAISFTLGNILLVGLIAQPLRRYTDAGGVFVPALAALALVLLGNQVRRTWTRLQSPSAELAARLSGKAQKLAAIPPEMTHAG